MFLLPVFSPAFGGISGVNFGHSDSCVEVSWHVFFFLRLPQGYSKVRFPFIPFLPSCCCSLIAKSCRTVCNCMDCNPPGSSVHGILPERILEWVTISFSRGSSQLRDRTCISCLPGRFFTTEPPGTPPFILVAGKWWQDQIMVTLKCKPSWDLFPCFVQAAWGSRPWWWIEII